MPDTTYVDFSQPTINANWLNDVNIAVYRAIGTGAGGSAPTTPAQVLTNLGVTSGMQTFLATPSSANLRAAVTDETGTGALVFGTSPTLTTPTLTTPTLTSPTVSTGNLSFSGTAQRITGDMSNATFANRLAFQSTTTNGNTSVFALPNGAAVNSSFQTFNNSDPTNAAVGVFGIVGSTDVRIQSGITGAGTYLPFTIYTGGSERVRIDTSGNVGIGTASPAQLVEASLSQNGKTQVKVTNVNAGASASAGVLFGTSSGDNGYIGANGGAASSALGGANAVQVANLTANPLVLATNATERMRISADGNVVQGTAAVATTATDGFLWITSCAGAPTGAPTAPYTNAAALVCDTTNTRLYVRVAGTWRYTALI